MATTKKYNRPILPRSRKDPTGVVDLEIKAMRAFRAIMRRVRDNFIESVRSIPRVAVNTKYTYQIDADMFNAIIAGLDHDLTRMLLEGGEENLWFVEQYIQTAYNRGVAQQVANIERQIPSIELVGALGVDRVYSEAHMRRIALVRSRMFEEMRGLAQDTKRDLSRVLADSIGRGLGITETIKNIKEHTGIAARRGARIARTEIPTALRRARWDEADDASEEYNLRTMEMHISAMLPTTREEHAERSGNLYTREEVREWWSEGANAINCRCSTVTVMVDDKGKPVVGDIIKKANRITFKE